MTNMNGHTPPRTNNQQKSAATPATAAAVNHTAASSASSAATSSSAHHQMPATPVVASPASPSPSASPPSASLHLNGLSLDQVKLLFGSIDIHSLGSITRYQFEETLNASGISLNDARLDAVRARLNEGIHYRHQQQQPQHATTTQPQQAYPASHLAPPSQQQQQNNNTTPSKHDTSILNSSGFSSTSSLLGVGSSLVDSTERIDLSRFAYIIEPNADLIARIIRRQLVIPDWPAFTSILSSIYEETRGCNDGKVADYIPELAFADPSWFGVSFCSIDGQLFSIGDSYQREYSVQSSSKPISYLMALTEHGLDYTHRFVGVEPSGRSFNDIALSHEFIPHNPMVNSGAIMVASLIQQQEEQSTRFRAIMECWRKCSGGGKSTNMTNKGKPQTSPSSSASTAAASSSSVMASPASQPNSSFSHSNSTSSTSTTAAPTPSTTTSSSNTVSVPSRNYITFSNSTYLSERATADRNFCLGYMMQENDSFNLGSTRFRHLPPREWGANDLVKNLELYFQCCSIQTTTQGQAIIGSTLASGGICSITDTEVFSAEHVRACLSLMLSCGMYDYSGEWAYKIGLPAKSGVSGCLMVVIPNVGGLSIYSPPLDALGNTVRGIEFCKKLVERCSFHYYDDMHGSTSSASSSTATSSPTSPLPHAPKINPCHSRNSIYHQELILLCTLCAKGDLIGIRSLISSGANVHGKDYDNRTPLHLASSEGQLDVVKYLITCTEKLDLNPIDRWGNTPFSDAVREGHREVAEYLFTKLKSQGITPSATAIRPAAATPAHATSNGTRH